MKALTNDVDDELTARADRRRGNDIVLVMVGVYACHYLEQLGTVWLIIVVVDSGVRHRKGRGSFDQRREGEMKLSCECLLACCLFLVACLLAWLARVLCVSEKKQQAPSGTRGRSSQPRCSTTS